MAKLDRLQSEFDKYFATNFDYNKFDTYVEQSLKDTGKCLIGILSSEIMGKELLSFQPRYSCYVWKTDCQINESCMDLVVKYLKKNGHEVTLKGETEDEWCLIKVKFGK